MTGVLVVPAARADVIERVMAIVEGQVILLSDVQAAIDLRLEVVSDPDDPPTGVLRRLIERQLILAEVERYAPPVPIPLVVAARVDEVRARFESGETFDDALRRLGIAEAQLVDRDPR